MRQFAMEDPLSEVAKLRNERLRSGVVLVIFALVFVVCAANSFASLGIRHGGGLWLCLALLGVVVACQTIWFAYIRRAIAANLAIPAAAWNGAMLLDSLGPTSLLFWQLESNPDMPENALASPALLAFLLLISASMLHLNPALCRLAGVAASAGYASAWLYAVATKPLAQTTYVRPAYLLCVLLLLAGGQVAGWVAAQIGKRVAAVASGVQAQIARAQAENEVALAQSLQQSLTSEALPEVEGFDMAAWTRSASVTGGDYFDWYSTDDGRLGLTVADVAGHGVGSVIGAALCRAFSRAILNDGPDLRCAVVRLNRFLLETLPAEQYVRMMTGILDAEDGSMEMIVAGHGPLMVYLSAEKRFRIYDSQGPPVGLLAKPNYGLPHRVRFGPGDVAVLITDGLIGCTNSEGEELGQERVKHTIRIHAQGSAASIVSAISEAALQFTGSAPQSDDLAVLILKRSVA